MYVKLLKSCYVCCRQKAEVDVIMEMRADINFETDLELTKTHGRIVVSFHIIV